MYKLNDIVLNVVETGVYEGEGPLDIRAGQKWFRLESESKRYSLRCFEDELGQLDMVG